MANRRHYTVPMGRLSDLGTHTAPERTMYREYAPGGRFTGDAECRVFPSREAMLVGLRLANQSATVGARKWRQLTTTTPTEG